MAYHESVWFALKRDIPSCIIIKGLLLLTWVELYKKMNCMNLNKYRDLGFETFWFVSLCKSWHNNVKFVKLVHLIDILTSNKHSILLTFARNAHALSWQMNLSILQPRYISTFLYLDLTLGKQISEKYTLTYVFKMEDNFQGW